MKLFVYGTLKSTEYNNTLLKDLGAEFLGSAVTYEKYPLFELNDPFPYLQDDFCSGEQVIGEVFEVDNKYIDKLDEYEGAPDLYYRDTIVVNLNKRMQEVVVYFKTDKVDLNKVTFLKEWTYKKRIKMEITMINRPRQTGKTTELKLMFHESMNEYQHILVLGHSASSNKALERYCRNFDDTKHSLNEIKHLNGANILVLIDEPFLIEKNNQQRIFDKLDELNGYNDITVWGIGTIPEYKAPIFEQFVERK